MIRRRLDVRRAMASGAKAFLVSVVDVFEAARTETVELTVDDSPFAYIIPAPTRGIIYRVSADVIRQMNELRPDLVDHDVVVTSHGKPSAVIISLDEYERLTGRRPT